MSSSACIETASPGISSGLRARLLAAAPLAVFAFALLALWLSYGNRLTLGTNDEGIYLDAGERILQGQKPYVDFFCYMSPGSFWMQALAFRLLGVSLAAGRAPVILYLALECALIYWLVERYASRAAAIVTAFVFLAFQAADPSMLTAQHRWDSSALSLASIALCVASQSESRRRRLVASGILGAFAALATPSVALVAIVTLAWLAGPAGRRAGAAWYLLGLSIATTAAGVALWANGTLLALLQQLGWLSRNYSSVNVMHYGAIIGGYRALFEGARTWELPVRFCVVFCLHSGPALRRSRYSSVSLAAGAAARLDRHLGRRVGNCICAAGTAARETSATAHAGGRRSGQCSGCAGDPGTAYPRGPTSVFVRLSIQATAVLSHANQKSHSLLLSLSRNDDKRRCWDRIIRTRSTAARLGALHGPEPSRVRTRVSFRQGVRFALSEA